MNNLNDQDNGEEFEDNANKESSIESESSQETTKENYIFDKEKYEKEYNAIKTNRDNEVKKLLLNLAVLSLVLDIFIGIGAFLGGVVCVFSIIKYTRKKTTTTLWSLLISLVATILGAVFFILFCCEFL